MTEFSEGTQIIYTPTHAEGDTEHPDSQQGFVTSANQHWVFCRYFYPDSNQMRTVRNSEGTQRRDLVIKNTRPQSIVQEALLGIRANIQQGE